MQSPGEQMLTANVEFKVAGNTIRARLSVPAGPIRPSELLPTCRSISEAIIETAVDRVKERRECVSCKAGCGACCRQIVPISEPEARAISSLVEGMDEPRRSAILQRFEDAKARLAEAGLLERLSGNSQFSHSEVQPFATEYFKLGIPCPFLEEESCSIYPDRPLICREYLVTSPAEECARPRPETIRMVPMPAQVSNALIRLGLKSGATRTRWVPLVLALDWVASNPEEESDRTGPELVEELFARLSEKGDNRK